MSWPIQFVEQRELTDFAINAIGNGAVVVVGGISIGIIAKLALEALGFTQIADAFALTATTTIASFGAPLVVAGVIIAAFPIFFIGGYFIKLLS